MIELLRLLLSLVLIYGLFQTTAIALDSNFGEYGILIAAMIVAALVVAEVLLFGRSPLAAIGLLGLGAPSPRGLAVALLVAALMLTALFCYCQLRGLPLTLKAGWGWL